jgi:chromosome partitioning protein
LDAAQAARAIQLVRSSGKAARRVIDFAILFSQIPPALRSLNFSDIEGQFADADIPVLPVAIYNREAYRTVFSTGGTLQNLSVRGVGNMKAAQENARAYAAAVIDRLKGQTSKENAQ